MPSVLGNPFIIDTNNHELSLLMPDAGKRLAFLKTVPSVRFHTEESPTKAVRMGNFNRGMTPNRFIDPQITMGSFIDRTDGQLEFLLDIGVHDQFPVVVIRLSIINLADYPIYLDAIDLISNSDAAGGVDLGCFAHLSPNEIGVFVNGWQSWVYSAVYRGDEKPRVSRLNLFQRNQWHNPTTPISRKSGHFSSDQFTVVIDQTAHTGCLAGFLTQHEHFGVLQTACKSGVTLQATASGDGARLDPGMRTTTDWFAIQMDHTDIPDRFGWFFETAARLEGTRLRQTIPNGWCSWYHYYTQISADETIKNLDILRDHHSNLPLDLVQLDDGYQTWVGDWMDFNERFPEGVKPLALKIKEAGFTPGIWIAPFILHPKSRTAREHPDWVLRKQNGKPAIAGYNWDVFTNALDLTLPEVKEYIRTVIQTAVYDWGYPYLKLDFLYAAAIDGVYNDPTKTRARVLRDGLELIRDTAGEETYLLGCGCPLGSGLGVFDAMRIGADVGPDWQPKFKGIELLTPNEPNLPSVKMALQNTVTRAMLHDRWWANDPDCLLLRDSTNLTETETITLASIIAMTGGSLLLSDDLETVSQSRLSIARKLLPVVGKRPWVIDWADKQTPALLRVDLQNATGDWHLISYTNWLDTPVEWALDPADFRLTTGSNYHYSLFWEERCGIVNSQEPLHLYLLPHQTIVASLRNDTPGQPAYIGSSLHLSQGLEVASWQFSPGRVAFTLRLDRDYTGEIVIALPAEPRTVLTDDKPTHFRVGKEGLFHIRISGKYETKIHILW